MSVKIQPPELRGKAYERYKNELKAWAEITDLGKSKRGIAVALTLPEQHESRIREKVFDQMKLEEIKAEDGLDKLITFMDKHLGKDDLTDSLEKFDDFENYHRKDEPISEYIAVFDQKYQKLEKLNMKLPSAILAFKLLRRADITNNERLLVLTGMDFQKKDELYDQAKVSLAKFKGEQSCIGTASNELIIKTEPVLLAQQEEAYVAASYAGRRPGYVRGQQGSLRPWKRPPNYIRGGIRQNIQGQSRNVNPPGPDGKPLLCKSCGSFRHFMAKCPDSWENKERVNVNVVSKTEKTEVPESEDVILFTGYKSDTLQEFCKEAQGSVVLDSACSSNVCGRKWIDSYIGTLSEDARSEVVENPGTKIFKFGGGEVLKSIASVNVPGTLAGKKIILNTDVVESDIPFLMSKDAMKKAKVKLDLEHDTAEVMGKSVSLNVTSSGHYCLPLDNNAEINVEQVCAVSLQKLDKKEQQETIVKLHRQFAHPPSEKLKSLMKDAGVWEDEMEDLLVSVANKCEMCKRYKKTPPRPIVSLPLANSFNDKVAIDLKKWQNLWILHMVDVWSRFTVSVLINRKRTTEVIENIMRNWIGVFGTMKSILSDNGGEFNSEEMREVGSILNVEINTTAAYSPFQNGVCERNHAVVDGILTKLVEDFPAYELNTLLCWANMVKNSMQMWNGYSSYQLVFGKNPNLPNIMTATPASLQGKTISETLAKHLNSLHASRLAFIKTDADERIRRALRNRIRAAEETYRNGDKVFYKRDGQEKWIGPGKVIFQDGQVVFVRHGGIFVRVSPTRLSRVGNSDCNDHHEARDLNMLEKEEDEESTKFDEESTKFEEESVLQSTERVKKNDCINYRATSEDNWTTATILGRAGKATGKYKHCYNIQDNISGEKGSVDLSQVEWNTTNMEQIEEIVNINFQEEKYQMQCAQAKQEELAKLKKFDTYEEVIWNDQNVISTRWVLTKKGDKVKARLVARGFEEEMNSPTDSPTVSKNAVRLFLTIAASQNWKVKTTDIKSAFLQGRKLERNVYIIPPKEANTEDGKIWKLRHCLYGLNDGARQFYLSVKEHLKSIGASQSSLEPALFYLKDGKLRGVVCCHVDDFLHAGDIQFENDVIAKLTRRFLAGKIEETSFIYIGFHLIQDERGITMTQLLGDCDDKVIHPQRAAEKSQHLNPSEQTLLRQIVGQLNWAVQGSRPDLAFDTIDLSTKLKSGTVGDLLQAGKLIRKMQEYEQKLFFPSLCLPVESWKLVVFTDAAHANICNGTGSVGAYVVFLVDSDGKCCTLAWKANKIKRVVRSSLAAETLSLQEGLECALYIQKLICELFGQISVPITAFVDNKSVVQAIQSTSLVDDKRLRIDIAAIKEELSTSQIKEVRWCPGEYQLANCMTKKGASGLNLLNVVQTGNFSKDF